MNRRTPIVTTMLLLATLTVRAQEHRVLVGPYAGYEFSVPLLLQRSAGAINYESDFAGTGTSYSHTAILGAQVLAHRGWSSLLGYSARIALFATSGNFTSDQFVPGIDLDTAARVAIDPNRYRYYAVDLTAASLVADAQLRLALGERIFAGAGVWLGYRLSGQFLRTERPVIVPPDIDVNDATLVTGGDRIASYAIGYGGIFSLGTIIPIGSHMSIVPEATSRLDAVALRRGMGFQAFTIGAGVSLVFDGADDLPIVETAGDLGDAVDVATPPKLEAHIDLYADNVEDRSAPAVVEAEEVVHTYSIAIPRALPLDNGALEIPGGFARLTREEAERFTLRSLAGCDVATHYRHVLDVLALRLRAVAGSSLALTGVSAPGEPESMGRVRAEVVRDYLRTTWAIASERIAIHAASGPRPMVALEGTPEIFVSPMLSQWRTRRYRMPPVGVDRSIVSDAGVRRWTLELEHGGRILGRYANDSTADDPTIDLRFLAGGDSTAAIAPIVATLTVEDSLGNVVVASDRLAVVRRRDASGASSRREHLEIIAFDASGDSAASARVRHAAARRAAAVLRDGAIVTVGAIGRIDDAARRARALEVAQAAEDLLTAANERGVRIERFVAERDVAATASVPPAIDIAIDQSRTDEQAREPE
jgi:hypothetical protein